MIVCAATNNAGKLKELRRILTRCGHEVKSLRELGVTLDPEETGTTLILYLFEAEWTDLPAE